MVGGLFTAQPKPACFVAIATQPSQKTRSVRSRTHLRTKAQQQSTDDAQMISTATTRRALLASAVIAAPLFSTVNAQAEEPTRVFFDVIVDRKPFGRIVIAIDGAATGAPIGAQRFLDLAEGKEGVGYRRTKIELLQDGYIQDSGLKALSYKASGRTAITGGPDAELLGNELNKSTRKHDEAGVVSLVVRLSEERESKEKLVAVNGQFVTVTQVFGEYPNGTAFAITTQAEPSLDATNLVVGRVVEGQDVVKALSGLRRVTDNSDSLFFKAGKAAGDRRANVAERAFGKPFSKIVIDECGLLS